MGYNSNCYDTSCFYDCCNILGYCPSSSSGCYYYYYDTTGLTIGAIVGIVLGCLFFIAMIAIIVCLCRRCQGGYYNTPRTNEIILVNTQPSYIGYNQAPYGAYGGRYQPNPLNQPMVL